MNEMTGVEMRRDDRDRNRYQKAVRKYQISERAVVESDSAGRGGVEAREETLTV